MAHEFDLIRRYRGAFSKEECKEIINYIEFFENNHILSYDRDSLHKEDHKTVNVTHDYNFVASSKLSTMIFPGFKPCLEEYLQTFSVLGQRKFLLHDLKLKKIPPGGGFHAWHYENGALSVAPRQFVVQLYLNDEFGVVRQNFYTNKEERKRLQVMSLCFLLHSHILTEEILL